jgi:molybdopterin-guanine dinucleotide biosynthesis protein A
MKNTIIQDCTGIILAGGENKRMPVLKAFIEVEGKKIIERNLKIMKKLFREICIVTNQPELYSYLGMPMLGDVYAIRGPMTGVLTALINSSNDWVFVSACDMPFIDPDVIRFMARERYNPTCITIINSGQKIALNTVPTAGIYDTVVPLVAYKAEPLFAFYSKKIMGSLEQFVLTGKKGIKYFLLNHDKRVKYITSEELRNIDPELRSLINLNTPEDVEIHLSEGDKLKFQQSLLIRNQQ